MNRRRTRGQQREYRRQLVALTRDSKRPAPLDRERAVIQPSQHVRRSSQ